MHPKTFSWMAVAILLAVFTPSAKAQKVAPGDWPMYRHDVEGSGYSPLKQIDTSNVNEARSGLDDAARRTRRT